MNKTIKTSIVLLTATLALTTGAVAAPAIQKGETMVVDTGDITGISVSMDYTVEVNGSIISEKGFYPKGAAEPLVPLRPIADALGFPLSWSNTSKTLNLNTGNVIATFKSGEDRYVANEKNIPLGTASVLKANRLYVPASFFSKILNYNISMQGNKVVITSAMQHTVDRGVITLINRDTKYPRIQIKGTGTEGLVLNVGEETIFQMEDGTHTTLSALQIGMTIEVEHANFATLSLPPQTPAYKVSVLDKHRTTDVLGTQGIIEQVIEHSDGQIGVQVKGNPLSDTSQKEIILNVDNNTVITDVNGEAVSIKHLTKGAKIIGFYTPMMTKSLPPISAAIKIVVE